MTSAGSLDLQAGAVIDGRFVVERHLGTGGMSHVIAVRHVALARRVALKLLRAEHADNPEIIVRFLREARGIARLTNEHVVDVMDVGTLPTGVPFMVMEYLEGNDFEKLLAQRGTFSAPEVIEYALQVLEALSEAHRAGIVHRDLKPANLFLTRRDDEFPLVKVLDFGISKFLTQSITITSDLTAPAAILGSPAYMSPEQIRDPSGVDARTDIWSMGILLYELLAGRTPFAGTNFPAIIAAISRDVQRPLRSFRADVPKELDVVVSRCLAKEREDRFACVEELARALGPLATSAASQVSLARILRTGGSLPPTPEAVVESDQTLREAVMFDAIDEARASTSSLKPVQTFQHAARIVVRSPLSALGAFALVAFGATALLVSFATGPRERAPAGRTVFTDAARPPTLVAPHVAPSSPSAKAMVTPPVPPATALLSSRATGAPRNVTEPSSHVAASKQLRPRQALSFQASRSPQLTPSANVRSKGQSPRALDLENPFGSAARE